MLNLPRTIEWFGNEVRLINQLKLPDSLEFIVTNDWTRIAEAIKKMEIRGAPAIGVAAGFGVGLAVLECRRKNMGLNECKNFLYHVIDELKKTRPTAVNLYWALNRLKDVIDRCNSVNSLIDNVIDEAKKIQIEDEQSNLKMGKLGSQLIRDGDTIITVCNAGSLATSYYGTATAPLYKAFEEGKKFRVLAMETRPYLQGARLTTWELSKVGIDVKLITDNSIGIVMEKEKIDLVFVGADRVTRKGYVANKIGTYPLALLSHVHNVPFYVVAPTSTIDLSIEYGDEIKIEERPSEEVIYIYGKRIVPKGVSALYYAFDITPPNLITGIITEKGIVYPPFERNILKMLKND
ncbi:MAG: S-methyl-5-thioribose-1-phosphate isomerase [Thermoproteales archaeon]|nr:S-methyl-5-thioribose-1-phosphate isomerase [Thermoproteales archaeon]